MASDEAKPWRAMRERQLYVRELEASGLTGES